LLRQSRNALSLETAFVGSAAHLEVSLHAPSCIPRVRDQPIRSPGFGAPAEDFHRVAANKTPGGVIVDPGFVVVKILVNIERSDNWAVGENFLADGSFVGRDVVGA